MEARTTLTNRYDVMDAWSRNPQFVRIRNTVAMAKIDTSIISRQIPRRSI